MILHCIEQFVSDRRNAQAVLALFPSEVQANLALKTVTATITGLFVHIQQL